jgi:hypothetical protein
MVAAPSTEPSSDLFGIRLEVNVSRVGLRHRNRISQGRLGPRIIAVATLERRMGRAVSLRYDVLRTKVAPSSANDSEREIGGSCKHPYQSRWHSIKGCSGSPVGLIEMR